MLLALAPAAASAAGPGATFLIGGLDLPAGAIAGAESGTAQGSADRPAVSHDGRYVAFVSAADVLDPAAHPDAVNVYRKDRATGQVVLVSRANGPAGAAFPFDSFSPAISDDGNRVAFMTVAPLDPSDTDGARDVYVRDIAAGTTVLASVGTTADVDDFDLSGNGRYVVFATFGQVLPSDANAHSDVYRRDLLTSTTELVSDDVAGGTRAGNGSSRMPSISDDGVWVAFSSAATDLISPAPGGASFQAYARDMTAGRTYLVSARDGSPTAGANGDASDTDITGTGDVGGSPPSGRPDKVLVAYTSIATDLDASSDGAPGASVFLRLIGDPQSRLVSRADGVAGVNADSRAHTPSVADGGAIVVFTSDATNLGAGDDYYGVYIRNHSTGRTRLLSASNRYAVRGAVSGNARYAVWYEAGASADSDPSLGAVFGRSYDAGSSTLGSISLVSRPPGAAPFLSPAIMVQTSGVDLQAPVVISADGRYVAFTARNTERLPGGRPGGAAQVYRRDTLTGAIELVSRANGPNGAPADGVQGVPAMSADGNRIAFSSTASLHPAHTGSTTEIYVRDIAAGTTVLVSRADGVAGAAANATSRNPAISADGNRVAFVTAATNLGVADRVSHVYLRDIPTGVTRLVDRASGPAGAAGNGAAEMPSLSRDGRLVAFASNATNLDPDDADSSSDIYVRDMATNVTALVSRRNGLDGRKAGSYSTSPALSADGRVVVFAASDEQIAPEAGPWRFAQQVVARTLATGANVLVSRGPDGTPANRDADSPSINADGSVVAFASSATNLLPGRGGNVRQAVFARNLATGALAGPPAFGIEGAYPQQGAMLPAISGDGQCVAFPARGHNAATGVAGDFLTAYVYVVSGACPKPLPEAPRVGRAGPPRIRARLARKRFRVGRARTARVAGVDRARVAARRRAAKRKVCKRGGRRVACRQRKAPAGTALVVWLSDRANVEIVVERKAQGRLVGRQCRRPTRKLRRNLRCVRWVKAHPTIVRRDVRAGTSRIPYSGRVGKKALKPGAHRARVRAVNGNGRSAWLRPLTFRVVKR